MCVWFCVVVVVVVVCVCVCVCVLEIISFQDEFVISSGTATPTHALYVFLNPRRSKKLLVCEGGIMGGVLVEVMLVNEGNIVVR